MGLLSPHPHPRLPRPRRPQRHCESNASRRQNSPSFPRRVTVAVPRHLWPLLLDPAPPGSTPHPPQIETTTTTKIRRLRCFFVHSRNNCSRCRSRSRLFSSRPRRLLLHQGGALFLPPHPSRQKQQQRHQKVAVGSAYHLLPTSHRLGHPLSLAKILAPSGEPEREGEREAGACSISEPKRTRRTNSPPPSSCDRCNTLLPRRRRRREKPPFDRILRVQASPGSAGVVVVAAPPIIMVMQAAPETKTRDMGESDMHPRTPTSARAHLLWRK